MSYKYLVIDTITGIVSASDGSVNPANRINIDNVDGAGTAAKLDSGISPGNVIIVQNDGKISCDVLPDISIIETFVINSEVISINGKTGVATLNTALVCG